MKRDTDNAVVNNNNAINNAKIKINAIKWYVPHYTPSLEQYNILKNRIVKKMPTELLYPERSVFMTEVITQNFWTFELAIQEGINVSMWIYVVFQENERQHDQNSNNDTFYRMPVTSCQCIVGTEKYADSAVLLNYDDDVCSQGYGQIKETFKTLTKDNILQPYISEHDFSSSNIAVGGNEIGYKLQSFDIDIRKFSKVLKHQK